MYQVDLKGYHSMNISLILYFEICWKDWTKAQLQTNDPSYPPFASILHLVYNIKYNLVHVYYFDIKQKNPFFANAE